MSQLRPNFPAGQVLPARWQAEAAPRLGEGEQVLACLELDLDGGLRFSSGLLAVTDRRLLACAGQGAGWQEWSFRGDLALQRSDHAGVGSLDLLEDGSLRARWRYTLARDTGAKQVVDHFERQRLAASTGRPAAASTQTLCPNCKTPIPPGQEECAVCAKS
ncbi:MAG TPA: ABC transporter, partial [Rhodocyclaceae bacterium]|nr:ABC transporter [Rhodocyclaceae bacterium]